LAADAQRHTWDAVWVVDPVMVIPAFAAIVTIRPVAPLAIDISAVVIVINASIYASIIVALLYVVGVSLHTVIWVALSFIYCNAASKTKSFTIFPIYKVLRKLFINPVKFNRGDVGFFPHFPGYLAPKALKNNILVYKTVTDL
jgi:hypothetical protein